MQNVTRDVIMDLWPLYLSGDASEDTRRLIEDFLNEHPEAAAELNASEVSLPRVLPPSLPPDHELRTLQLVRRRLEGPFWLMYLAILFSAFAFGRIVSDTSFDVSPRGFIIAASIAVFLWLAFFVALLRGRRAVLIRLR